MRTALGPLADAAEAMAVLRAVSEPTFFDSLRAGTRTTEQVGSLVTAVIVPWLRERSAPPRREHASDQRVG